MIKLGYIAPILLIALPLAACEKDNPMENALTLMNGGTPMPGGPSTSALYVSQTVERVEPVEVVAEVEPPCHVPASHFRSHWCNPDTGKFELIP
jgi:hypothetical protein